MGRRWTQIIRIKKWSCKSVKNREIRVCLPFVSFVVEKYLCGPPRLRALCVKKWSRENPWNPCPNFENEHRAPLLCSQRLAKGSKRARRPWPRLNRGSALLQFLEKNKKRLVSYGIPLFSRRRWSKRRINWHMAFCCSGITWAKSNAWWYYRWVQKEKRN